MERIVLEEGMAASGCFSGVGFFWGVGVGVYVLLMEVLCDVLSIGLAVS